MPLAWHQIWRHQETTHKSVQVFLSLLDYITPSLKSPLLVYSPNKSGLCGSHSSFQFTSSLCSPNSHPPTGLPVHTFSLPFQFTPSHCSPIHTFPLISNSHLPAGLPVHTFPIHTLPTAQWSLWLGSHTSFQFTPPTALPIHTSLLLSL